MSNGDEFLFPGGVYFEGSVEIGNRTGVSLVQSGPQKNCGPEKDGLITLGLRIMTGSCEFELLGILPEDMKRLGEWIASLARKPEFERRKYG